MNNIFVVSDVHGTYLTLMKLLKVMKVTDNDTIINLGDVVDRGPRIKECLDFFMNRKNVINIMGNHDFYFLDYALKGWTGKNIFMKAQGLSETIQQVGTDIEKYAKFVSTWKNYVINEDNKYVFCHASYPWRNWEEGEFREGHLWERYYYELDSEYLDYDGPLIVHGHTPTKNPYEILENKLIGYDLDGGNCYGGPNACLRGLRLSDEKFFEVKNCD